MEPEAAFLSNATSSYSLGKIFLDVIDILEADGDAHQAAGNADRRPLFWGKPVVRCCCWVGGKAFSVT